MGKSKKTFIDRKNAVTFHLVHRSQHDPLVADENAPQRVLVEVAKAGEPEHDKHQQHKKYGITFDDNYDYLQHLKKPGQEIVWEYVANPNQTKNRVEAGSSVAPKLQLPSSVFASEFEEEDGMLSRAAPRPGPRLDWDPDVVAALDYFDFENEQNQLDDNFVLQAMEGNDDYIEDTSNISDVAYEAVVMSHGKEENGDEVRGQQHPFVFRNRGADVETGSRFTDYSISSSVIFRNKQLTLLDDRFEKFYASYDDPELGDLCMEEIEGTWGQKHPYVLGCYQLFKRSDVLEDYNKDWDKHRIQKYGIIAEDNEISEEEVNEIEVNDPSEKKWDCVSIISTYANIYNHPKIIDEPKKFCRSPERKIQVDRKTGLPENILRGCDKGELTAKALASYENCDSSNMGPKSLCDKSVVSALTVLSIRPKDESHEEKKERKRLLKEYRQERRIERKANADAFKIEKKRQIQIKLNAQYNVQ